VSQGRHDDDPWGPHADAQLGQTNAAGLLSGLGQGTEEQLRWLELPVASASLAATDRLKRHHASCGHIRISR